MHDQGLSKLKCASKWLLPICALFWATPQLAQDAVKNTPPELKDFRLDPETKPQEPKPEPPKAAPPELIVPTITPEPKPSVTAEPKRETPIPQSAKRASPKAIVAASRSDTVNEISPKPNEALGPVPSETTSGSQAKPESLGVTPQATSNAEPAALPEAPNTLPAVPWLEIAFAALALVMAGLGTIFIRRRQAKSQGDNVSPQSLADVPAVPSEEAAEPSYALLPTAQIEIKAKAQKPPKPAARPMLDVRFIPEKATISFSSLTIKGELRIINQSNSPAKSMRLRAAIISASEMQNTIIAGFHNNPAQGTIEELGPAAGDERVAMQIELTIPLSELKTYPLGDQQLFVPIVLANVYYEWQGKAAHDEARITCMVGREANPPQPKMGPFRLDRGPRSFASLGQRPIFA